MTLRHHRLALQHHDAITGTGCDNQEGCAGTDQVVGPHNVIGDYHTMLADSLAGTAQVAATILGALATTATTATSANARDLLANARPDAARSAATGTTKKNGTVGGGGGGADADAPPLPFSLDAGDMGKILMGYGDGGDDAMLVVYNPMATVRTEIVSIAVPVCAVDVTDADSGAPVVSQVTANFKIGDGQSLRPTSAWCGGGSTQPLSPLYSVIFQFLEKRSIVLMICSLALDDVTNTCTRARTSTVLRL